MFLLPRSRVDRRALDCIMTEVFLEMLRSAQWELAGHSSEPRRSQRPAFFRLFAPQLFPPLVSGAPNFFPRHESTVRMRTMVSKRVLRYIKRFGLKTGLQAARMHTRPGSVVPIRLAAFAHPVWARAGTSDVETFEEVF